MKLSSAIQFIYRLTFNFITMGLLSGLFKGQKKTFHSPEWGEFTLVFSNGANRIWNTKKDQVSYTVRGTDEAPHADQIDFLSKTKVEMEKLDQAIGEKFSAILPAEGIKVDFNHWKEKFEITNIEVVSLEGSSPQWNLYFRDLKTGTELTLFIEGNQVANFSIDT